MNFTLVSLFYMSKETGGVDLSQVAEFRSAKVVASAIEENYLSAVVEMPKTASVAGAVALWDEVAVVFYVAKLQGAVFGDDEFVHSGGWLVCGCCRPKPIIS